MSNCVVLGDDGRDYFNRADLLGMGLEGATVEAVLRLAGTDVIHRDQSPELLKSVCRDKQRRACP
jgi:hypothetical protein